MMPNATIEMVECPSVKLEHPLFVTERHDVDPGNTSATGENGAGALEELRSEQYCLVDFAQEESFELQLSFLQLGLRMIEQQRTFSAAEKLATRIIEMIISASGVRAVELLKAAYSETAAFADVIAATGALELTEGKQEITSYLSELKAGSDKRLAQAAEDALDLLEFAGESN
jgi:hypothetical protein